MKKDEVESALQTIHSIIGGKECLVKLTELSAVLGEYFCDVVEEKQRPPEFFKHLTGHGQTKMAVWLLGREKISAIIEKNLVLFLSRIATAIEPINLLSPQEKTAIIIRKLDSFSTLARAWSVHLQESTQHVHDKKERRLRRQAHQHNAAHEIKSSIPSLLEGVVHRLLSLLLPEGGKSLYLPSGGAALLAPKIDEMLETAIPSLSLWMAEFMARRDLKIDMLYQLYSGLYRWTQIDTPLSEPSSIKNPSSSLPSLEPVLECLLQTFAPMVLTSKIDLSMETVAEKITEKLIRLSSNPLEPLAIQMFRKALTALSSTAPLHSEKDLEQLIQLMSHDEKILRALIKTVIPPPDLPVPKRANIQSVFCELLLYGLKASATEAMAQGAIQTLPWEECQQTMLERFRWFALSPYFDVAVLQECIF